MKDKKAKHTSDERAEELIRRFSFLTDEYYQTKCALEIAKENCYVHGWNGPCQSNTGHHSYWNRVKTYLEEKIKKFEETGY